MKIAKKLSTIIVGFLSIGEVPTVHATLLSPLEASPVLQGTIPDGDFFLLTQFFGFKAGETLNYQSTSDLSGWSATLSGVYLGTNLNVTYLGNLSAFPAGPITWTSSGSYGSDIWSGSGSASITDTLTGFQVDFDSLLNVGGNSGLFDVLIDGTADPSEITYVGTSGAALINGVPFGSPFEFTLEWEIAPGVFLNDFDIISPPSPFSRPKIISIFPTFPTPPFPTPLTFGGPLSTVPEPSSLLLLGAGALGAFGIGWRHRKSMSSKGERVEGVIV